MRIRFIVGVISCWLWTMFGLSLGFSQQPGEGHLPQFAAAGQQGVINLALEASPFTGEAGTTVPIELLPSAGNMQEKIKLELQYRSGGSDSWVGKGWELESGYIARINKFGAGNSNNPYLLVLNGQSSELVCIGGSQYRTKMESHKRIDFNGSIWQVWDRDGTVYKFETFCAGKWVLTKVSDTHGISMVIEYDRISTESISSFISNVDYNPANHPTQITFSNPTTTRFDYYPENQRLKSILSGSLQDLYYDYDKVGSITKIIDAVHSKSRDYTYDDLNRLISGESISYKYNAIGNLVEANGLQQQYSSARPHALTSDGINIYSYDGCGNIIAGAERAITYDAENRPLKITRNGISTQFIYDGDGKRVKKIVSNAGLTTATIYIENLYEKEITAQQ